MKNITSKNVKNYILDPDSHLDEVIYLFEIDCKATSEGVFNSLFIMLKNYIKNRERIDCLVNTVEELVRVKNNDELKSLLGPIKDFNNKINNTFSIEEKSIIRDVSFRTNNILNKINNNIIVDDRNNKFRCMEYLVFQDKNISMIESIINNNNYTDVLSVFDNNGNNILDVIIKEYIYLDEKDVENINYYYHLIHLFISKYGESIIKDRNKYLNIIRESKLMYKEHIIKVIELFNPEFKIDLDEIESRYDVSFDFPNVIINEMYSFVMDNDDRVDFSNQECVTIDGNNSKCLDDALYIEKCLDGSYNLYIHIADVPSFIPFKSLVDEEAKKRGETLYLKDRNLSIYPEYLSDYLCSILPYNNRNVITYIFKLDSNFSVIEDSFRVVKGKINSRYRFTYEDADNIIKNPTDCMRDKILLQLYCFADKRRRENTKKEDYRKYENFLSFEKRHESLKIDCSPSANIVHEAMILTNYSIAKYFKELSLPYIYRKFSIPSDDFIENQLNKIKEMSPGIVNNKEFLGLLRDSYMEALYCNEPVIHKGLNLECYSHSTSPLRRYADSFGQYVIYDLLFDENLNDFSIKSWDYRINNMVNYLNKRNKENEKFASHYNYLAYKKLIKVDKK